MDAFEARWAYEDIHGTKWFWTRHSLRSKVTTQWQLAVVGVLGWFWREDNRKIFAIFEFARGSSINSGDLERRVHNTMFALLFDLEDYATTYRATRDAYLKAANELKLATGPYKAARDAYVAATATYTKSLYE